MSDELKIAIEAAKAGAKKGMEYFNQDIPVSIKEDKTVVTKANSSAGGGNGYFCRW
jgi:3'-phosphoadenosine 5'-phosphosulfate (PAPS) 3'-phosphatase